MQISIVRDLHFKPAEHLAQDGAQLRHGERLARAVLRADRERHKRTVICGDFGLRDNRTAWKRVALLFEPSIGPKSVGKGRVVLIIALYRVDVYPNFGAFWYKAVGSHE